MDSVVLDVERLGISQESRSQRVTLGENSHPSISLEPLSPPHPEATPRSSADITVAVTSKTAAPYNNPCHASTSATPHSSLNCNLTSN